MIQFHIQPDSEIPASTQLYNQLEFAIASGQYPPGHRLPSTRQLAMQTGLHRNTISKVYRQLEQAGVVEAQAGSGIYVRPQGDEGEVRALTPLMQQYPQAHRLIKHNLDQLVKEGCSLTEIRELFMAEVDWRLTSNAQVLVTAPTEDIGAGQLIADELEQSLKVPVRLVPLEELGQVLEQTRSGTVVTSRYFIQDAEAIAAPRSVRVIPVDIYDYAKEIKMITGLPQDSCLGLVSISPGFLRAAEVIVYSLRGDSLLIMTAQVNNRYKLDALIHSAQTIISDQASLGKVKAAIQSVRNDLIRPPQLICAENYIGAKSISLMKRELGLE